MPESDSSTWVVGRWLGRVVNGWLNDYAVPGRGRFIRGFPAADSASALRAGQHHRLIAAHPCRVVDRMGVAALISSIGLRADMVAEVWCR